MWVRVSLDIFGPAQVRGTVASRSTLARSCTSQHHCSGTSAEIVVMKRRVQFKVGISHVIAGARTRVGGCGDGMQSGQVQMFTYSQKA